MDQSPDAATERLLAAISHVDSKRQAPLFKAFLERQLDALEQYDIEYFDFLADTVVLAQQRMQDLRLEVIELRLDDLENPRFNMRDLVIDVVNDVDCVRDIVGGNEGVEALDRQRAMMPPHCRKGNPRESHRQASGSSALPS